MPLNSDEISIDFKAFGGITFDFDQPGKSTVFIDDICLKTSHATAIGNPTKEKLPAAVEAEIADAGLPRGKAMWLWALDPMLDDPTNAESLFLFCVANGVSQIWTQIAYDMTPQKANGQSILNGSKCVLRRAAELREFIRLAHKNGVQVHALDGYPEHAQREYHHVSLAVVDAVITFNSGRPIEEQFDGIHFDNEPHLLIGWNDPQRRQQILFEFLTLNGECQRRVDAASSKLEFGIDIPFWLQDRDPLQGEPIGIVSFNGRRQAASYHLLEMLDNVGVMNYRDLAQGADGMIAHGRGLIEHADKAARAKVFMGVETFASQPINVLFAVGRKREDFYSAVRGEARDLASLSRLDEHRIRVFDDGANIHIGIEVNEATAVEQRLAIAATIATLARAFGIDAKSDLESARQIQSNLENRLKNDAEWSSVSPLTVRDPETKETHLLVKATSSMLEKITFADDSAEQLKMQLDLAENYFVKHPSYRAMAVHDYESFRKLVTESIAAGKEVAIK